MERALDELERARLAAELLQESAFADVGDLLLDLVESLESERKRLVRFGFDLHDGALQDVALLGADMHKFREQLGAPDALDDRRRIVGRVDDLIARLSAIDAKLRDLANTAEAGALISHPLAVSLAELVSSYDGSPTTHAWVDPRLDEGVLTDSQKIAVLRIVGAAVLNAVRHSGAENVWVRLTQLPDAISVSIRDDGRGFAVQEALRHATANGRLGLAGMHQRAALLGGKLTIESAPGGPTEVRLHLPNWWRRSDAAT